MALRIPSQNRPQPATATAQSAAIGPPPIVEWGDEDANIMPSMLLASESGGGKTYAIARMCAAGFNLCFVDVESKAHILKKYKPLRVPIAQPQEEGVRASAQLRYDRLMRFADALAGGGYRKHKGKTIDVIAIDGIMEVGDIIHLDHKRRYTRKDSLIMWEEIGIRTVDWIKSLRDAAGYAATSMGLPPVGIVATIGEHKIGIGAEQTYEYMLPGRKALKALPFQFEVVLHLDTGLDTDGEHVYRVHTVRGENFYAKSPAGVFEKCVIGKGVNVDGKPDVGAMYRALLTNPESPYVNEQYRVNEEPPREEAP